MQTVSILTKLTALLAVGLVLGTTRGNTPARAQAASAATVSKSPEQKSPAQLAQLMRGILLPNSNLLFAAENTNPADVPPAKHASSAVNPLEGTYGQWQAVENAALAISETASLVSAPGRVCSNGRPVPVNNADWPQLVAKLRSAGLQAYVTAQAKNQDKLEQATDALTAACSNCHVKYRDTPKLEDRCR